MGDLVFAVVLLFAGAFIAIAGQFLPKTWQQRATLLIAALVAVTALVWVVFDVADFTLTRQRLGPPATERARIEPSATPTATPTLFPTAKPSPTIPATFTPDAADAPDAAGTPEATASPGTTAEPGATATRSRAGTEDPTLTPGQTTEATAKPTKEPKATKTPKPTKMPRATKTPGPPKRRLDLKKVGPRTRAVLATNLTEGTQTQIFSQAKRQPIHSAAWSPDGKTVLIAYRWETSQYVQGISLRLFDDEGGGGKSILALDTAGRSRKLGNALWSPDGKTIALWLLDGPDDGVFLLEADGTGLRRLDHSVPGEWPRYWSVDGDWIITIAGDNLLYALEVEGTRRLPLSEPGVGKLYDERFHPWKIVDEPRCEKRTRSWWACK